jgi:hypothetical protein
MEYRVCHCESFYPDGDGDDEHRSKREEFVAVDDNEAETKFKKMQERPSPMRCVRSNFTLARIDQREKLTRLAIRTR